MAHDQYKTLSEKEELKKSYTTNRYENISDEDEMESSSDVEVYSVDDENMFMGLG